MKKHSSRPAAGRPTAFIAVLLLIEFLDEFVFGAREAAWPLIRDDLSLTYAQIGILLSVPNVFSSFVEPVLGILGDVWRRRALVLGGGIVYGLAMFLTGASQSFVMLLAVFMVTYPASGAFVNLAQSTLMDMDLSRSEHNMARWTFAGSVGVVAGPLALGFFYLIGSDWRGVFIFYGVLFFVLVAAAWRFPFPTPQADEHDEPRQPILPAFVQGVREAWQAAKRPPVLHWVVLLQFTDLMLDVLLGFLAIYFVDVVAVTPQQAGIAVAVWSVVGLIGDFLLIPLLERVPGLRYLRISAGLVLILFPAFLLVPGYLPKLGLLAVIGLLNAGWYAIPTGRIYAALPGQSGTVMSIGNVVGFFGGLLPLGLGLIAQRFSLSLTMWLLVAGPVALLFFMPRDHDSEPPSPAQP